MVGARGEGNRTAVIETVSGAHHSYAALDADADAWSARLARWGVRHGDRVAILSHNRYEFLPLFFGCIRRGAILVPLNWRLTAPELARVLDDASPSLLLGEDRLRSLAEEPCVFRLSTTDWGGVTSIAISRRNTTRRPRRPSVQPKAAGTMLLYTSGSTGTPKGVIIPHRQLIWNAIATATGWLLNASDVGPAATPFFHTGGWNVFTTPLLSRGGTIVLIDG